MRTWATGFICAALLATVGRTVPVSRADERLGGDASPYPAAGEAVADSRLSPAGPPPAETASGVALLVRAGTGADEGDVARRAAAGAPGRTVIVVVGAAGEPAYGRDFAAQAEAWQKAAQAAQARVVMVGGESAAPDGAADRVRLEQALAAEPKRGAEEVWLVLIGHGTFDGAVAKFNLRGPDMSAADLAGWLKPFERPVVLIDTSSASAPFLAALSAPNRVVITSTRSGFEQNYTRFGRFLANAINDPRSDLDKDGQVSVLEAFLLAARNTGAFYKEEGRLATEHPLIDDNGDGHGTPADWFKGVRATRKAEGGTELDGVRARQFCLVRSTAEQELSPAARERRNELERQVEQLRSAKASLPEGEYFDRLEQLMLELSAVYEGPS